MYCLQAETGGAYKAKPTEHFSRRISKVTLSMAEQERELLEKRARLIEECIKSNPEFMKAIMAGYEGNHRGEGIPADEYFDKRGISKTV